jgi:hypothetical protein
MGWMEDIAVKYFLNGYEFSKRQCKCQYQNEFPWISLDPNPPISETKTRV